MNTIEKYKTRNFATFPFIFESYAYKWIDAFYCGQKAERSGVPLINHINEGLDILYEIDAELPTMEAFCLHPLFQTDEALQQSLQSSYISKISINALILTMEYRNIANQSLSDIVRTSFYDYELSRPIKLSPIHEVNQMLIADKVQNKKDFMRHHLLTHQKSGELRFYFDKWLEALNVSDEQYQNLTKFL